MLVATKLYKSLVKGGHDDDHKLRLQKAIDKSEAAARLADACSKRASPATYGTMFSDLKSLAGSSVHPTINISRK